MYSHLLIPFFSSSHLRRKKQPRLNSTLCLLHTYAQRSETYGQKPGTLVSPKSMTMHLKWVFQAAHPSYHISHLSGVTVSNILFSDFQFLLPSAHLQPMALLYRTLGSPTTNSTALSSHQCLIKGCIPSFSAGELPFLLSETPPLVLKMSTTVFYFTFIHDFPSWLDHPHQHTNMLQFLPS